MMFTPAYAQDVGAPVGPGLIDLMLPLVFIFIIMYFLIIRPQRRRLNEHQEMISALRRGDEVITAGGLIAKITKVKEGDEEVEAEISDGVKVRFVKNTISGVMSKTEPAVAKK